MIKPDKYMNMDLSVINIGGLILKTLISRPIQKHEEVEDYVLTELGDKAKPVFLYALDFLYVLGRIRYQAETDSIKLLK